MSSKRKSSDTDPNTPGASRTSKAQSTPPEKKVKAGLRSRKLALEILLTVERENAYANLALAGAFRHNELSERDRGFVTALVQGVLRHRMSLDETMAQLSSRSLDKLPAALKNVLRLGLFQLIFMPNLPPSAVLNTATELAKTFGHQGLAKFTNGVLRSYVRKMDKEGSVNSVANDTSEPVENHVANSEDVSETETNEVARLSTSYSMPAWIVERWLKNFGKNETIALLTFSQSTPVLAVRTNEMAITPEGLEQIFANEGITCQKGRLVESCLIIERGERQASATAHKKSSFHGSPLKLPGYAEGLFSVQDEAAAFVAVVTAPRAGEVIIDLCAAPGGKTVHMAEMMDNHGRIIAVDVSETRLNLIKSNRTRLELTNIETVACDGRSFQFEQGADRVLIDAPCTGTGVLNRRSDMRYQRQPGDLAQLVELQRELLANAATLVKPGGIIVYSTCSIEAEENFDNIRWFLQNFEAFEGDDFASLLPEFIRRECAPGIAGPACKTEVELDRLHMVQLLPSRHGVSGFFIARLKRKS